MLVEHVRPGVTTQALDDLVFDFAMAHGAYPAPLDYRGYRKSICTSINHVVCHGIPDDKPLREGDIVNIDVTFILDGWHGDASRMFGVGEIPRRAQRLIDVTYESLLRGIAAVKPGATTGDIGAAIQHYAESERCSVVRDFCGHGLGRYSTTSRIFCIMAQKGQGVQLRPGMFFTIEPMINLGRPQVKILSDGWTAVTRDRSLSAQFEHSVGVTETGVEDLHPVAARARQSHSGDAARRTMKKPRLATRQARRSGPARGGAPHFHGHRQRLRDRFMEAGDAALADYELLELLLFRAIARRDVKPLAKALIARFGSFAEIVAARPETAARDRRARRGGDRAKSSSSRPRRATTGARRLAEAHGALLIHGGARLLPNGHGLSPSARSFASCSSTSATR